MRLYIGLISGTSMDGIDAALVDMDSHQLIGGLIHPYRDTVHQLLKEMVLAKEVRPERLAQLNTLVGIEFSDAAEALLAKTKTQASDVLAIGSHGQTIAHEPRAEIPYTIQLGCGHVIAEKTKIDVVADFRTRDLVNGGQAAPFAPIYHQALFDHLADSLVLVNIGGIANLSLINSDAVMKGYDTGPGSCLLDRWIEKHLSLPYDHSGQWSATGKIIDELLQSFLSDPYFELPAPKSTSTAYFSLDWLLKRINNSSYLAQDVQATILELTVQTIAASIIDLKLDFEKILLCGGGAHNQQLILRLQALLPLHQVATTADYSFNPDYIEAMMMAWLADKTINKIPLDFSSVTGAKKAAVLGVIYPAGI